MKPLIIIPARMASQRLPGKPLADICGVPMILRVAAAARAAGFGEPLIAAGDAQIDECARQAGYRSVLTAPELPSGSDRVQAALVRSPDLSDMDCIVNLQGDLPDIDPASIRAVVDVLKRVETADIATLVAPIQSKDERDDENVVKAVLSPIGDSDPALFRALYFSRKAVPAGDGPHYHHIGIYAYRRAALARFTALPPGTLEQRESLEQLRALENGMHIAAALVEEVPLAVDSPADLEQARVRIGE